MLLRQLEIGAHVIIKVMRNGNEKYANSIVNTVEGDKVGLSAPMDGIQFLHLSKNETIEVMSTRNGGIVIWPCNMVEASYNSKVPMIYLKSDVKGIVYNRRNAFRVEIMHDIKYECKQQTHKGIIVDMSALGLGLLTKAKHNVGDYIKFAVNMLGKDVTIKAQIIRQPFKAENADMQNYGAIFVDVDSDLVRKYVNEQQRIQLRNRNKMIN